MDEKFKTELKRAVTDVRSATGLNLELEDTGGGCWALSARLESGHIIVATELDGPWTIGLYQPCNGTRSCLLDDDDHNRTYYPHGCGHWCDYETAEFFAFSTQFDQLPACIATALSTYTTLPDRHTPQPVHEGGLPRGRIHHLTP